MLHFLDSNTRKALHSVFIYILRAFLEFSLYKLFSLITDDKTFDKLLTLNLFAVMILNSSHMKKKASFSEEVHERRAGTATF